MYDINQEMSRLIVELIEEYPDDEVAISVSRLKGDPKDLQALPSNVDKLTKVREVNLDWTRVTDMGALAQFTEMRSLCLSLTPGTDFSALSCLKRLEVLMLRNVPLTDLSFIKGLKSLKCLDISGTAIADFSAIAACKKLVELSLNKTAISDLSPLSGLTKLQRINLDDTQISSIAPLTGLTSLSELSISRTGVDTLEPLSSMAKLKRLRIDHTGICDLSPLADAIKMVDLSANHCAIDDLTPLAEMNKLSCVYLGSTHVSDITPIAGNKLRDLYLDGSQLADLIPIKGNRSIPRIDIDETGLSFRDTPVAKQDLDGFGFIADMHNPYARTDALYRYFRKVKTWPLKRPLPPLKLAPVPAPPVQVGWPFLERIEEDLLELESPPVTDDSIYETFFDPLVLLAEAAYKDTQSLKRTDKGALFELCNHFANKFAYREKNLNWRFLEQQRLRLSYALYETDRAGTDTHGVSLQTSRKLLALLDEICERNPTKHRLAHLYEPDDAAPAQVTDLHLAILATFESRDHYLFQWEARHLACGIEGVDRRASWAPKIADVLCRNAIVMIGDYANAYMAGTVMTTDKSQDSLLWLDKHQDIVAAYSQTQGDEFARWVEITQENTRAWIRACKPLRNPVFHGYRELDDIRYVEDRVWSGYYRWS